MVTAPRLLPPSTLEEALTPISNLDDARFEHLRGEVLSSRAFNSDKKRSEELASALGIRKEQVGYLLQTLSFLFNQVHTAAADGLGFDTAFQALANSLHEKRFVGDDYQKLLTRLPLLLAPNPNVDKAAKIRRLRTGFLRNAVGFSTFIDLRPNYADDDQKIEALVPMVQLRITTDAEDEESRLVVVQVDEENLAELDRAIQRARKKIASAKSNPTFGSLIYHD